MKAAIYARYSSENQRPESIEDQINSCRRFARCFRHQVWVKESLSPNHPDTSSRF